MTRDELHALIAEQACGGGHKLSSGQRILCDFGLTAATAALDVLDELPPNERPYARSGDPAEVTPPITTSPPEPIDVTTFEDIAELDKDFKFGIQPGTPLDQAVHEALGAASVCWNGAPLCVFMDHRARAIADALLAHITTMTCWRGKVEPGNMTGDGVK